MSTRFINYLARKAKEYGSKFDGSDLAEQFVEHYNIGESRRIKVLLPGNETMWGYVGVTTGWNPTFILMRSITAKGSSTILNKDCKILAQKDKA